MIQSQNSRQNLTRSLLWNNPYGWSILFFTFLQLANPSLVLADTKMYFKSAHDRFVLTKAAGESYKLGNQDVSLGSLKEFLPMFNQDFVDPCGQLPSKPDLTIRIVREDASGLGKKTSVKREFYFQDKSLKHGNNCLAVGGDGIYYLPVHRSWFIGKKTLRINLKNSFKLMRGEETLFNFENKMGRWRASGKSPFINWDFFNRFKKAIEKFDIDARLNLAAKQSQTPILIETASGRHELYKVGKNLWALKLANVNWLIASRDWSFFGDFTDGQWINHNHGKLEFILNPSNGLEQRLGTISSLGSAWNPTIKYAFQDLMLKKTEEAEIKKRVLRKLKQHPSEDNFKVLGQALEYTEDYSLQEAISKVLRIRNPNGPLVSQELEDDERRSALKKWKQWLNSMK